jgi:segregation and condensation protein B
MNNELLEKQIESILFWKAEPVTFSDLAKILQVPVETIKESAQNLLLKTRDRGMVLIVNNEEISLVTSPETSELIEKLQKEELTKDLSKAALETLSIILYRGPMKRADIDYIRGVNSQFILRILLIRGLIDKKVDEKDERAYVYTASTDALAYLGVQQVKDLPQYEEVNRDIDTFLEKQKNVEEKNHASENQTE